MTNQLAVNEDIYFFKDMFGFAEHQETATSG